MSLPPAQPTKSKLASSSDKFAAAKRPSSKANQKRVEISGPSEVRVEIHGEKDRDTGNIKGIKEMEDRVSEEQHRHQNPRNVTPPQIILPKLNITGPTNVVHKLHVDQDLNWTGASSKASLQLVKKLGEGAYGTVHKALHIPTQSPLAIKCVSTVGVDLTEVKQEIEILKACRHDNIVSLFGCTDSEGQLWILMDFCQLGSVKDLYKALHRTANEDEVRAVLYFVLQGLAYLHKSGIIHRDLKPANILVNDSGEVKIADFGVSYAMNSNKAKTVIGTPLFMAPEALEGGDYDERADIWSVGISAIEMSDGVAPYHDEHVMRAMLLIATSDPPTIKNAATASKEYIAFLARCLQKEAAKRPSAAELLSDAFFAKGGFKETMAMLTAECKIARMNEIDEVESANNAPIISAPLSPCPNSTPVSIHSHTVNRHLMDLLEKSQREMMREKAHKDTVELYSNMSFQQLTDEIKQMQERVLYLERSLRKK